MRSRLERCGLSESGWLVLWGDACYSDVLYRPGNVVMEEGVYCLFRQGVLGKDVLYDVWRAIDSVEGECADTARYWFVDRAYSWLDSGSVLGLRYVPRSRWLAAPHLIVLSGDRLIGYRYVRRNPSVRLWLKNLEDCRDWGRFYKGFWEATECLQRE